MTKLMTFNQENKDIIDYIKQERIKKGITQKQLAEMAGVSLSLIGTTESYKNKYSKSTIKKIFKALDLNIKDANIFPENKSQAIDNVIDLLTVIRIDLSPGIPLKQKLEFMISDRFIDNAKDINELQFKTKGKLLINEREFFDPFIEDFKKNNQDYYAVVINDDSLLPIALKGDYLIIKYLYNFDYSDFFIKKERQGITIPKLFILAKPDNDKLDKLVRYVKIIHDYSYKHSLFYAFLYLSERYEADKYARLVGSDFYFKNRDIRIVGEVIAVIKPRPTVKSFND
jgi:transcriptional regulator with XRE-family HTH domain